MLHTAIEHHNHIIEMTHDLATCIIEAFSLSLDAFAARDLTLLKRSRTQLKRVSDDANKIDNAIVKMFALYEPEAKILREMVAHLKMTNELVRIASAGRQYTKEMRFVLESELDLSSIEEDLIRLHTATINALRAAFDRESDAERKVRNTLLEESQCDDLYHIIEKELIQNLCILDDALTDQLRLLNIVRRFERASDHAVNIARLYHFAEYGGSVEQF